MNKDLVICHLDDGATLNGTDRRHRQGLCARRAEPPGGCADRSDSGRSLYSPVRQVSYKVDNARIGQELDFDKLSLTVETDGTVTPEDAVAYAARILQDQLALFVHFEDIVPAGVAP
jgi:DNA-directed RNA polymerase subunit alpha